MGRGDRHRHSRTGSRSSPASGFSSRREANQIGGVPVRRARCFVRFLESDPSGRWHKTPRSRISLGLERSELLVGRHVSGDRRTSAAGGCSTARVTATAVPSDSPKYTTATGHVGATGQVRPGGPAVYGEPVLRRSPGSSRWPRASSYFRPSRCLTLGQSRLSAMKAARSGQHKNGFVARSRPIVELGRTP